MSYLDLGKRRLYGLLVALALMAVSAYSAIPWLVARALPGKWVGLPEFEAASQKLGGSRPCFTISCGLVLGVADESRNELD